MTRALIVDDNRDNLYMLRALLQGHGYAVEEARHGAEALTRARQDPPDLIISDLLMPVMDGYTLLRHWRTDDQLRSIPFIVYTATYTEPLDERLARSLGADEFIVKPAEPEPFMTAVRATLANCHRGAATGSEPPEETVLLKEYNAVLVRKLEKKAQELEQANRELLAEVAERKRTEAELRDSEERYRVTFEQAAVGMAHVDTDGRFLRVNDRFCDITGYPRDELLRRSFLDLTMPEDRPAADEARRAMLARTRAVYAMEKRYLRMDGGVVWVSLATTPLRDAAGRPRYFITVITDVTERKKLAEQLQQSQKMEAVGRLAGGVAHDFNNLLTVINGYSEIVSAGMPPEDRSRELVLEIGRAGERAAGLTRQLLAFSRQTMLQPKVLNLNTVVSETSKLLHRLIGEDVQFTTVLDPHLGPVKVDPGQLDQVLMNLAVNARDAMPRGGRLTVETANVTLGEDDVAPHTGCFAGPYVMLAVTDTGCGMSPEVMARVFEPFFTTKEVGKGTGLGLAMVFGIVQQSGGFIRVFSEPGRGTTFSIYLPAVGEAYTATADATAGPVARGTETVLLVEDDAAVRGLAAISLKSHGYNVLTAVDGEDALKVAREHSGPVDLVLSDVVMPKLAGPELVGVLKARFTRLKVLYMSGYTDDAVLRHGLLEANVSFIQKPYSPLQLARKVRQVLDESGVMLKPSQVSS